MIRLAERTLARFWKKVNKNGSIPAHAPELGQCWEWLKGKDGGGYAQFHIKGREWKAHRVSWMILHGEISPGIVICHKCDNKICVNPNHLFSGTPLDNVADMFAKKRDNRPFGERCHLAKLKTAQVVEVKRLASMKKRASEIARLTGLKYHAVWQIVRGKIWKQVKCPPDEHQTLPAGV